MDILNKDVLERIIHFAAVSSPRLPNGDGGALACCQLESVCSSLCVLGHQVSWQRIAKSRWNDCNVSLGDARTWRNWYIQRHVFERRVYTALRMAGNDHINTTLHQRDHFKDVIEASIAYNDGNDVNAKPIVYTRQEISRFHITQTRHCGIYDKKRSKRASPKCFCSRLTGITAKKWPYCIKVGY
eukprot:m.242254 g.242254  ORF g.242254 m.242254 type:complete len:185 (+) comp33792_c1_seq4:102-656(+)